MRSTTPAIPTAGRRSSRRSSVSPISRRKAAVEGTLTFEIATPLIDLTKAQIIRRGIELGVDFSLTVSCYQADAQGRACGRCDACRLRRDGFKAAGVPDPTRYCSIGMVHELGRRRFGYHARPAGTALPLQFVGR